MESNNNLYKPPEATPQMTQGVQQSGYVSVLGLGNASRFLLYAFMLLCIGLGLFSIWNGSQNAQGIDPCYDEFGEALPIYRTYEAVSWLYTIIFFVHVIVFCFWTYKVVKNSWTRSSVPGVQSVSPGWAVGYYFIPILYLWKPYGAMKEVWRTTFDDSKSTGILLLWWWVWIFSNVIEQVASKIEGGESIESYAEVEYLFAFSYFVDLAAAILLCGIVKKITAQQDSYYRMQLF